MYQSKKQINLILSGGGVKGIAYVGAFEVAEQKNYAWGNIAGVSAGALAGVYAAAGFQAQEMKNIIGSFDFGSINMEELPEKIPGLRYYKEFAESYRSSGPASIKSFLGMHYFRIGESGTEFQLQHLGVRGNILKNAVLFSKEGCLFNGDVLEEWVYKVLLQKGIRTFADLRGGTTDRVNPGGYKVRMTAVDACRGRIITLPDDISFYGMNPDKLEVAKAVRMTTSVPFAFKPVEMKKKENGREKTYYIVDGGVLDNFPYWLVQNTVVSKTVGFRLDGGKSNSIISLDTPLKILKAIISAVHDIGVPAGVFPPGQVASIDTSKVDFLDFSLDEEKKDYLIEQGKKSAMVLFTNLELLKSGRSRMFYPMLYRLGRNFRRI